MTPHIRSIRYMWDNSDRVSRHSDADGSLFWHSSSDLQDPQYLWVLEWRISLACAKTAYVGFKRGAPLENGSLPDLLIIAAFHPALHWKPA